MKNKVLIFDFDGVIVDSIDIVKDILSDFCKKYGSRGTLGAKGYL